MDVCWYFHCPECGFGDKERGYLAADHELVCEVCLEEDRIRVRLRRWPAEAEPSAETQRAAA